jgi:hypothetical protein
MRKSSWNFVNQIQAKGAPAEGHIVKRQGWNENPPKGDHGNMCPTDRWHDCWEPGPYRDMNFGSRMPC